MWEKAESGPGMAHMGKGRGAGMLMAMWDKLDDDAKKTLATRMVDERILKKELRIKLLEHKVETLKMIKKTIEKM